MTSPSHHPDDCRDAQLMVSFLDGDASALDRLAAIYLPHVARFALTMLGDEENAADAAQETFLRVIQSAERFDTAKPFRPWLFALARHACQDLRRRHARLLRKHQHYAENAADTQGLDAVAINDRDTPGPARVVAIDPTEDVRTILSRHEDAGLALKLLEEMEETPRSVLALRLFEDLNFAEIAEVMERPLSTITSIYYRNIERLRTAMEEARNRESALHYSARSEAN